MTGGVKTALGVEVVVAAGCREAAAAAIESWRAGGNVVDAAIAGALVQCVAMPEATGIGGDLFALMRRNGRVSAINATGSAPAAATVEAFRRLGHGRIPLRGPLSVQPPGFLAGIELLHRRGGSRMICELFAPAIALAEHGCAVSRRLAAALRELSEESWAAPAWREVFAPAGRRLAEGESLRQSALARTLRTIARASPRSFYAGAIARDIAGTVERGGGLLAEADLAAVRAISAPPLAIRSRGRCFMTQPPVSQGVVLLRALTLLGRAVGPGRPPGETTLWRHALNALQTAFAERLRLLGDTPDARAIAEGLLAAPPASAGAMRALAMRPGGETTTLAVIDHRGDAVALSQSVFEDLGAGLISDQTGVILNNRLSAFFLDERHPNRLRPRRSTMHTLHTFIVEDQRGSMLAGGTPGGDHQPQVNLQVLTRILTLNEAPERAIAAPRWSLAPGTHPLDLARSLQPAVACEPGLDPALIEAFREDGFGIRSDAAGIGSSKIVAFDIVSGSVRG